MLESSTRQIAGRQHVGDDLGLDDDDFAVIADWINAYLIACAWLGVKPLSPSALAQLVASEFGVALTLQ